MLEPSFRFDLKKMRYVRLAGRHTVQKTANALGISRNAYYKKERGDTNITLDEFCILMTLFGVDRAGMMDYFTDTTDTSKG